MTESLFQRPTVFTANPDAPTAWTIETGWEQYDRAVILGGDLWRGNDGITWRLRAYSPLFKDIEHDSSHLIDLHIAGLTVSGGYSSLRFEGYLVEGWWYENPENLSLNSMADEHGKPWREGREPVLCEESYCEGLPSHLVGAQYMAPKRDFEPRKIQLGHGPVTWYALEDLNDPTLWDRSTETLFWHEVREVKEEDQRIWTRTVNTNWRPQYD